METRHSPKFSTKVVLNDDARHGSFASTFDARLERTTN